MGQCYSTEERHCEKRSYHAAAAANNAQQPRNAVLIINNEISFSSINGLGNINKRLIIVMLRLIQNKLSYLLKKHILTNFYLQLRMKIQKQNNMKYIF